MFSTSAKNEIKSTSLFILRVSRRLSLSLTFSESVFQKISSSPSSFGFTGTLLLHPELRWFGSLVLPDNAGDILLLVDHVGGPGGDVWREGGLSDEAAVP